jgi:hypothetical protein
MRRCLPCLLLLLLLFSGPAQSKKKDPDIPALFRQAHYVYVEAVDGDEFNPRLYPEGRQAIADVGHALQTWKRYVLTIRRQDADLVFVVRKGRLAAAQGSMLARGLLSPRRPIKTRTGMILLDTQTREQRSEHPVRLDLRMTSFLCTQYGPMAAAVRESGCSQERTDSTPRRCRSSNRLRTLSTKLTHDRTRPALLPWRRRNVPFLVQTDG